MAGRVTEGILYAKGQEAISRNRDKMVKNQEQAVTGKIVNRPSDNPVAAMRVVGLHAQGERIEQVSQNMEIASAILNMTDSSLGELTDVIARAKELAIQMSSSSNQSDDSRLATKNEVEQLTARTIQIGNTRIGDRYIFGGYQTDRPPFDLDGNYYGDDGVFEIEVDRGQKLAVNTPGLVPFLGMDKISEAQQTLRADQLHDKEPTLDSGLRGPASLDAKAVADTSKNSDGTPKVATSNMEREVYSAGQGQNIFRVFKSFAEGLGSGDRTAINNALDGLDGVFKQALAARATIGARQNLVRASQDGLDLGKVNNAEQLSNTQDADSVKTFSDLAKNEHALNATLETSKRLITPSLLDFLK